jgi:hypothetical protein
MRISLSTFNSLVSCLTASLKQCDGWGSFVLLLYKMGGLPVAAERWMPLIFIVGKYSRYCLREFEMLHSYLYLLSIEALSEAKLALVDCVCNKL